MDRAALGLSAATIAIKDEPGSRRFLPASLRARVTNIGQIVDQFNLDIVGLPAHWYSQIGEGMRLRPGVDGRVDVNFHPPRAAEATAGPHPFTVRIISQEQPSSIVETEVVLHIDPFVDTVLDLVEPLQAADGEAFFQVRLHHRGNVPLTYSLSAQAGENEPLTVTFQSNQIMLSPGAQETIDIRVVPSLVNGRQQPPGSYPFTVQAVPVIPGGAWSDLMPPPLTATGTLVLRPSPPVEVQVEAGRVELVDLLVREAICTVRVRNPSRRLIGATLETRAASAHYDVHPTLEHLLLAPESEQTITLTIQRSALAPLTAAPLRQPFQITLRQTEWLAEPSAIPQSAPLAAQGSVTFTAVPPVEVLIQPLGLRLDLTPRRQRGGRGHFRVILTNQGAHPVPVVLGLHDLDREVKYAFGPKPKHFTSSRQASSSGRSARQRGDVVVVEPQGRTEVALEVRTARTRIGGEPLACPFSVHAAVDHHVLEDLNREAEFEYQPTSRVRVAAFLLLPLLILGGITVTPVVAGYDLPSTIASIWAQLPVLVSPNRPSPPPPPTSVPKPEPTTAQPKASLHQIELDNTAFTGGFSNPGGSHYPDSTGERRTATWIYGARSDFPRMTARFRLESRPVGEARLTLVGMDAQGAAKMRIRVTINDTTIFEEENPLENNRWSQVTLRVPAGALQAGDNTVAIHSLAPDRNFNAPPWFMLDRARLEFST